MQLGNLFKVDWFHLYQIAEKTNEFSLDIEEKEVTLGFNVRYTRVFESSYEGVLTVHSRRGLNNRYAYLWYCIYGNTLNYRLNIYTSLKVLNLEAIRKYFEE